MYVSDGTGDARRLEGVHLTGDDLLDLVHVDVRWY
jgi:hypothetical protein